jgi:hypothetical protein
MEERTCVLEDEGFQSVLISVFTHGNLRPDIEAHLKLITEDSAWARSVW